MTSDIHKSGVRLPTLQLTTSHSQRLNRKASRHRLLWVAVVHWNIIILERALVLWN